MVPLLRASAMSFVWPTTVSRHFGLLAFASMTVFAVEWSIIRRDGSILSHSTSYEASSVWHFFWAWKLPGCLGVLLLQCFACFNSSGCTFSWDISFLRGDWGSLLLLWLSVSAYHSAFCGHIAWRFFSLCLGLFAPVLWLNVLWFLARTSSYAFCLSYPRMPSTSWCGSSQYVFPLGFAVVHFILALSTHCMSVPNYSSLWLQPSWWFVTVLTVLRRRLSLFSKFTDRVQQMNFVQMNL